MSELTREETRRAALAVGWEWNIPEVCAEDNGLPWFLDSDDGQGALALLEAWRKQDPARRYWTLSSPTGTAIASEPTYTVRLSNDFREWQAWSPDLPTAAVRAVNQATAQTPGAEPREGGEG